MSRTTNFKGSPLEILGDEIKLGQTAPAFSLTAQDMSEIKSSDFAGKKIILSLVPSIDTPVCSIETKKFNQEVSKLGNEVVCITASLDLPFAQKRWCAAEGVENVILASDYKHQSLGKAYGAFIKDWALFSRAVFVINSAGKVTFAEYVPEVSQEPNYDQILEAAKKA